MIKKLIEELLKVAFIDEGKGVKRSIKLDDVLIVAPYNLQVNKIKKAIPDIKVGTVDRFQGQEAPIVIISMSASDANDSARGLEFIFNKNRLNVAISRAQVLAIIVAAPNLANAKCKTIEQMELVNLFCRVAELSH